MYLAAFDMKKIELEKQIRKQNVEENVKSKTIEIAESLLQEKYSDESVTHKKISEVCRSFILNYFLRMLISQKMFFIV